MTFSCDQVWRHIHSMPMAARVVIVAALLWTLYSALWLSWVSLVRWIDARPQQRDDRGRFVHKRLRLPWRRPSVTKEPASPSSAPTFDDDDV